MTGKKMRGFEQHVLEEDRMSADWRKGSFEAKEACRKCKNKNAWDLMQQCCQKQCHESFNALQAFPYAAWGDISAAPLDPVKATAARKLEIEYAEKKPVWNKIPRWEATEKGWGLVKPRWIDINKGDDENPNYRSRMVGKEFNDSWHWFWQHGCTRSQAFLCLHFLQASFASDEPILQSALTRSSSNICCSKPLLFPQSSPSTSFSMSLTTSSVLRRFESSIRLANLAEFVSTDSSYFPPKLTL